MSNTEPPPTGARDEPGRWLTRAETAERLRVSLATVDRYARSGHLPIYRLPGEGDGPRRFWSTDVDALLQAGSS